MFSASQMFYKFHERISIPRLLPLMSHAPSFQRGYGSCQGDLEMFDTSVCGTGNPHLHT